MKCRSCGVLMVKNVGSGVVNSKCPKCGCVYDEGFDEWFEKEEQW